MLFDDDYDKKSDFNKTIDDLDDAIFLNYITKENEDKNRKSSGDKGGSLLWNLFLVISFVIIIGGIIAKFF